MKTSTLNSWALTAALLVSGAAAAQSAGTAITFQGELIRDGTPVAGTCDCQFSLYTDELGVEQIGGTLSFEGGFAIPMNDGLFTAILDFGPAIFDGDQRWLEVAVRTPHDPSDAAPFTTLAPRQPLTAAPYALSGIGPGRPSPPPGVYR